MEDNSENSEKETAPAPLTEAYHKARRNYGLFSGLLIAWEFVGIELTQTPLKNFNVTLKSPSAAQYVLISLLIYFAYRLTVEWFQCDNARRDMKPSKIDFFVAHLLGFFSIGLYSIQRMLDLRLADYDIDLAMTMYGFGLLGGYVAVRSRKFKSRDLRAIMKVSYVIIVGGTTFLIISKIIQHENWLDRSTVIAAYVSGFLTPFLFKFSYKSNFFQNILFLNNSE